MLEALEVSVSALRTQPTIAIITLVEHVAVLAVLIAASIFGAHAKRKLEVFVRSPEASGITYKNI
jgi:hypothetical protein